jgi:hypothetical protein
VANIYRFILQHLSLTTRWNKGDTKDIADQIPGWLELAKKVLPHEAEKVSSLVARLINREMKRDIESRTQSDLMVSEGGHL